MTWAPPNPAHALTFDEIELAGLDGTLRDVGGSRRTCHADLSLMRLETVEYRPLEVTEHGNVTLPENYKADEIAIHESSIWCETHGRLGFDQYEAHGISDDWEET